MVLQAPITRELHLALREAVVELRVGERRRHFPVTVHAGLPGGATRAVVEPVGGGLDHGLRTDIAAALLHWCAQQGAPALVWITRPGDLSIQDADLAWGAAVRAALAEAGRSGEFVVVTREGWQDPVSGVGRRWRRLRPRPGDARPGPGTGT